MALDYKSAAPDALRTEYNRIAAEIGDDQFFTKKELNHLPEVLADGEQVLAFTSGIMDGNTWLITLTDRRVIFLDKGMLYGLKQASIELDKINAVSGKTGLLFGDILIQDGGGERKITNVWKKTVTAFTNKVRDAIHAKKQPVMASASTNDDMISKLERLAALRDRGVLTPEEFAEQKVKILSIV
ncbi:PH domain-containing protein [Pseudomonas aeruginosa]